MTAFFRPKGEAMCYTKNLTISSPKAPIVDLITSSSITESIAGAICSAIITISLFATVLLGLTEFAQAKINVGGNFPSFKLPLLKSSGTFDSSSSRGKILIVNFWASWCGPCKLELPALDRLQKKYSHRGLMIIGVNLDEKKSDALAFLQSLPIGITNVYDGDKQSLVEKCKIDRLPTSFIIDRSGKVMARHEAFREGDEKKIDAEILILLNGNAQKNETQLLGRPNETN
jgi:thiol-disulfide isomerase/thioredoxin